MNTSEYVIFYGDNNNDDDDDKCVVIRCFKMKKRGDEDATKIRTVLVAVDVSRFFLLISSYISIDASSKFQSDFDRIFIATSLSQFEYEHNEATMSSRSSSSAFILLEKIFFL